MSADVIPRRSIEVLRLRQKVGVAIVTLALVALGVLIFWDVVNQADLDATERVIGSVIGVGFGGMGLLFLIDLPGMLGRHTLEFDQDGLRYRVWISRVKPFRVSWTELATVSLSTADKRTRTSRRTFVRLDLTPADPDGFAARHPEMATMRGDGGVGETTWRLGFGPNGRLVPEVADALRTFAGPRYRGVDDDGQASSWTYR